MFFKILDKAGLRRIRLHDLRHTYATLRIQAGHNIADVSRQLGHHSINITVDTYYHWMPGNEKSNWCGSEQSLRRSSKAYSRSCAILFMITTKDETSSWRNCGPSPAALGMAETLIRCRYDLTQIGPADRPAGRTAIRQVRPLLTEVGLPAR